MDDHRSSFTLNDPDAPLADTLGGLARRQVAARRRVLRALAAASLASPLRALACSIIPTETGGPYPGDGTNGPNVLTQSGIVRSDIRASFGTAGTALTPGTPLAITLQLVSTNDNCAPLAGYAVYVWHCNASGQYSLYSSGVTSQNFLRGVQVTDADGKVTFTTIYPGAYAGRWPHVHFEVYASAAQAVLGANAVKTSQLALPDATSREVYAQSALYPGSLTHLDQTPLASDNVFSDDGAALQMATVSGSVATGYAAALQVGMAAAVGSAGPDVDQQGLTGVWYEPASSGQGFALEVYPDLHATGRGFLAGGWFTYDIAPAGGVEKRRRYTFGGEVVAGTSTASIPIYVNTGGNLNALPVTTARPAGTATLTLSSCSSARFDYALTDGSARSGSIPLARGTPNMTCSMTTSRPTNADFALSGAWYDAATSGQGFIVEVNPSAPVLSFAWYTYAADGASLAGASGQRWFTAQAPYTAGTRSIVLMLYETSGGVFDAGTPPTQTTAAVGTATLTFQSCSSATLIFEFTAGANSGRSGTIVLGRAGSVPAGCAA